MGIRSCRYFSFFCKFVGEIFGCNMLNKWIPLATFSLIFSSFSWNSNSDSSWQVSNTLIPNKLIKLRINSNIRCFHHLSNKSLNLMNSSWGFLFELSSMSKLVDVDSCINCCFTESFSLFFFNHDYKIINII